MESSIKNVEDLDKKSGTEGGIKYGCVVDQSTASFFQVGIILCKCCMKYSKIKKNHITKYSRNKNPK